MGITPIQSLGTLLRRNEMFCVSKRRKRDFAGSLFHIQIFDPRRSIFENSKKY
jgi:hypothetical protein